MAFSLVQVAHGGFTFGGTSGTAVFSSNVTSGNSIVVLWCFRETQNQAIGAYTVSVTDSVSSSYGSAKTSLAFFDATGRNHVDYIHAAAVGASGANTVTVSVSAGLTAANCKGGAVFAFEVSGLTSTTPEATGSNTGNSAANNPVVATSSNLTWTDAPFLACLIHMNSLSATYTPTAAYSTVKDESTNDSFAVVYSATSGVITSPSNFQTTIATTSDGGQSVLGAAFPAGIAIMGGWDNQGPPPQRPRWRRVSNADEQWARTLVLLPPWGWDNQGPSPKPLPFHRLPKLDEQWPFNVVPIRPNRFAWWYDKPHMLPPQRLWRPPVQPYDTLFPITPPPNLVTQLGWENQGPRPQRLQWRPPVQPYETWPFLVVATPTQFGWEIQTNPPMRVPFHRLPQLEDVVWPFATVAVTPTQFGWEIPGNPPIRIPWHRLPQLDGNVPAGYTPGPPFLAYGYLRALKVG